MTEKRNISGPDIPAPAEREAGHDGGPSFRPGPPRLLDRAGSASLYSDDADGTKPNSDAPIVSAGFDGWPGGGGGLESILSRRGEPSFLLAMEVTDAMFGDRPEKLKLLHGGRMVNYELRSCWCFGAVIDIYRPHDLDDPADLPGRVLTAWTSWVRDETGCLQVLLTREWWNEICGLAKAAMAVAHASGEERPAAEARLLDFIDDRAGRGGQWSV